MSRSIPHRKAQLSLEALFIMAIILVGIVVVIPYYSSQNSAMSITSYIRSDAQFACSYLTAGVMKNETSYYYLNSIISTYGPVNLVFQNMSYSSGSNVTIIITLLSLKQQPISVRRGIRNFIISDLLSRGLLKGNLSSPVYNGRPFILNVSVVVK